MTTPALSPVHFLLVDDLEENLLALEGLLRRPELVLLRARSGTEALELLLKHDVALALVDVQMPTMDGFELAELMRGTERTRRVPIIFLTAGSSDSRRRFRGYETGAVDFLSKPIEPDVLRTKADVFFELYRQRQEVARQRDDLKVAADRIQQLLAESERQSAALKEADQRKDEFLAMLAHELRNPLAPIRSAVDLLKLQAIEDEAVETTREIISRQVTHMVRLVDDLLDVARIARGKIELQYEVFDLGEVTRQTAEDLRVPLETKGLKLEIDVAEAPLIVHGDRVRLAQVIGNLMNNAGKFTPRGGTVTVTASADAANRDVIVSVADTGVGLQPELLPKLFEPFYQANPTIDRKLGGLGLGLALAKGMVDMHRGTIEAASNGINQGSRFTIRLPAQTDARRLDGAIQPPQPIEPRSLRVLVIEDNPDAAFTLQRLIASLGHEVDSCFDGVTALRQLQADPVDVVISDLGLPGSLDGFQVAASIRADQRFVNVRLVALSGYGRDEDRQRAFDSGFDEFLIKPVELQALRHVLATDARQS